MPVHPTLIKSSGHYDLTQETVILFPSNDILNESNDTVHQEHASDKVMYAMSEHDIHI